MDTSGEQIDIKKIFDTFDAEAQRAAVSVVPAVADGCALTDLTAHLIADHAGPLTQITTIHLISGGGGPSRGTLRSLAESIDVIKTGGLTYHDGDWRTGIPASQATTSSPDSPEPVPLMKFPMPEVITIPRHIRVQRVTGLAEATLGDQLSTPITPQLISSLPEGPLLVAAAASGSPTSSTPSPQTDTTYAAPCKAPTPTGQPRSSWPKAPSA